MNDVKPGQRVLLVSPDSIAPNIEGMVARADSPVYIEFGVTDETPAEYAAKITASLKATNDFYAAADRAGTNDRAEVTDGDGGRP